MSVIVNNVVADHHMYVVPDVVDGRVVSEQAQRRAIKQGETTYVHHHPKHKQGAPQTKENELDCLGFDHDMYVPPNA
jgi:hypothetical protein